MTTRRANSAICRVTALMLATFSAFASDSLESKKPQPDGAIKQVIDSRCVICHGCYDAPCQLKLGSMDGILRGATTQSVYNPSRLKDMAPTRLFVDAQGVGAWRNRGFHGVVGVDEQGGLICDDCILKQLLDLKEQYSVDEGKKLPANFPLNINRKLDCPSPNDIKAFRHEHSYGGMPYGMSPISKADTAILRKWLSGDSTYPSAVLPSKTDLRLIEDWQRFLNGSDHQQQLVSRYLYEHLFLAHIYFEETPKLYFRLVRSSTPAPNVIKEIATIRPNDPYNGQIYYRFLPVAETIVDKTHMPFRFDEKTLDHWRSLFMKRKIEVNKNHGSTPREAGNPFLAFRSIPARIRYLFLLENARFIIQSFIKGPVCRGQVALNVINDNFYVAFLSPESDPFIDDRNFRDHTIPLLSLPRESIGNSQLAQQWHTRLHEHRNYLQYRSKHYSSHPKTRSGITVDDLWLGNQYSDINALTIYRHFDSGTVLPGFVDDTPQTMMVLDFTTLERIYYNLVVNFNVFGNLAHQIETRLYMDYLRMEGELLFMTLMPEKARKPLLKGWYQDVDAQIKLFWVHHDALLHLPTRKEFSMESTFVGVLATIKKKLNVNDHSSAGSVKAEGDELFKTFLNDKEAKEHAWIDYLPENIHIVLHGPGNDVANVYTLLRNRAHSNVSFIFSEKYRLVPERDTTTLIGGSVGSYPNFIFWISLEHNSLFIKQLTSVSTPSDFEALVNRFGVRRSDRRIWDTIDKLHDYRARVLGKIGMLDFNRYQNL